MTTHATPARSCAGIDWDAWSPGIRATLLFIFQDGHVLLMRKKRGLGAGKINGPGGKIEAGESAAECALRETREELGVIAANPELAGELRFQFTDGLGIHCLVFRTSEFSGIPEESDEGAPFWCDTRAIPYDEMWRDDRHWLPAVIDGRTFRGDFVFEGDTMLDFRLEIEPA